MPESLDLTGDLAIYVGDSYALQFTLVDDQDPPGDFDPTGYTFAAQLRTSKRAAASVAFAIDVDTTTDTVVTLSLTPAQTALFFGAACPRVWDLQVTAPDGFVDTWFAGSVDVEGDVTR